MIAVCPILYLGYKFVNKTKLHRSDEIDLVKNVDEIEEYQRTYVPSPPKYVFFYISCERPFLFTNVTTGTPLTGCWIGCLDRAILMTEEQRATNQVRVILQQS